MKLFSSLACLEMKDRDVTKAENYFKMAVERETQVGVVYVRVSSHLHNNLGVFYYKKGEFRKSLMEFEQVIEWVEETEKQGDNKEEILMHLNYNIGCVYRKTLKTDQALHYLEHSEKIANKIFGPGHIYSSCIKSDI